VRGAFVPRLYLRRLLLPYCTLALSKRDSVSLSCDNFRRLLLEPDSFKASLTVRREAQGQLLMQFHDSDRAADFEEIYDDLDEGG
jgi:hypothetical protein